VRSTVLSEEELRRISDASLQILEKTELRMPLSAERRDALAGKGLFFEEEEWNGSPSLRVRFSPESVATALQSAPKTYTLYARNSENDLIAGLTNEYYGVAHFLRNGKRVEVPTFLEEDYETVDFGGKIGVMEAFVAGGGTSTMPWTYEGKIRTLWNKTLRWPGHFAQWKAYMDAGLLEEEPVDVDGVRVSPRALLHRVLDPKLRARPEDRDFVIVRVKGIGEKNGCRAEVLLDLIDYYDEATGFTAMERTTGWDGAITAILNAQGVTPRGVHPVELAVPGKRFAEELRKRGFSLKESFTVHRE
jgi:hypothetical protein